MQPLDENGYLSLPTGRPRYSGHLLESSTFPRKFVLTDEETLALKELFTASRFAPRVYFGASEASIYKALLTDGSSVFVSKSHF